MQSVTDDTGRITSRVPTLVPPYLITLYATVAAKRSRDEIVTTWARLRRSLFPVERVPLARSAERLPGVDWVAHARALGMRPWLVLERDDELEGELTHDGAIAAALALASLRAESALTLDQLREAARALVLIDGSIRRGLCASPLAALAESVAGRMVRQALIAIGFVEAFTDDRSMLCAVATAAMVQPMLDELTSVESVCGTLARAALREPRLLPEAVIAAEAALLRRERPPLCASLHARLVAMACDEARQSLIEGRPSSLSIEIDLSALEEQAMAAAP